jgi:DNA-binding transcriptional ArsR family regulator
MQDDTEKAQWDAVLFRVLADPTRLRIIYQLLDGPRGVGDIVQELGVRQSLVSHHLAVLRKHGVVSAERRAQAVVYELPERIAGALDGRTLDLGCCIVTFRPSARAPGEATDSGPAPG